ncbi:phage Gp37/Gp68 family protein [Nonomuraea rosea]|uniref:Phage Gp37/Gp68 family protein n=1 Tax=Nonomuraea rosea TaxID=638574 RepID=A0ABP6WG62_9ACTN
MSDNSKIEWTDATWNVVTGCTKVSPGCDNCYAETFAERWRGIPGHHFEQGFDVTLRPERLDLPLKWRKPRRIFVNSMSDLFHDAVPDDFIARVFATMALTPQHTYQLLTKRHGRMRSFLTNPPKNDDGEYETDVGWLPGAGAKWMVAEALEEIGRDADRRLTEDQWSLTEWPAGRLEWPLPNVWLGVSVEDQKRADLRIPSLLDTPAAVRFLSCEPLRSLIDLRNMTKRFGAVIDCLSGDLKSPGGGTVYASTPSVIDWVIAGGESGPGARPAHPDWFRQLRDQCQDAGVAFHFKQWGEWVPESMWLHRDTAPAAFLSTDGSTRPLVNGKPTAAPMSRGKDITIRRVGKKAAGRELDGRTWNEFPEVAS